MPTLVLITVILLYIYGPKKESIKWLIFAMSFAALYDLDHLVSGSALPLIFLHKVVTPYGFLMFSIVHSELVSSRTKNALAVGLFFPIVMMCAIAVEKLNLELDYQVLLLWVAPYYLTTSFLLIFAYVKERNPKKKRLRLIAACVVVPSTIADLFLENVVQALGFHVNEFWYMYMFAATGFVIFIVFAIRFGVFGVKIKFEKQLLDQTITGIASGTSMLNHALKNRITNIDMLALRMQETSKLLQYQHINGDVKLILAETKHMMQMVKRIQKQIEEVEIIEAADNLNEIVRHALQSNQYLFESKHISVTVNDLAQFRILCDKVHLQEVFSNVLRNAIDAVEAGKGVLSITVYDNKRNILIDIADNGKGVAKEAVHKIFDPFYSTKHKEDNFGLGLSYCYLVVRKHGGKIEVAGNEPSGATFTVHLPKSRIV
ncbi:sensor histidine kinase [Cohnella silvisoli]|uniref:histidine kinase n=1 Tax=Cohnella silvisoli TaxID=2873699 RepID=A0ABV1KX65_9BACL|nr:HAMP domain-containing sensor histidine kinase [Cohnella silvisoli]MCD9024082.1 HAMP domain-containing histidine kinase [Cohnella silvisoli]